MSMGDWASTFPSALTVAISFFWSAMFDEMPSARADTAAEQAVPEPPPEFGGAPDEEGANGSGVVASTRELK
jgi:hypothetical protein